MANEAIGTVRDWLIQNFGETAGDIPGVSSWGRTTISGAYFVIDKDGSLFVQCGGEAVVGFKRDHTVDKRPLYLVVDGDRGEMWKMRNAMNTQPLHVSKPRNVLRLVMCG